MDCSLPGSSVQGIFQARVMEWVAISFFGDLPNPGIEPRSPTLQTDTLLSEPPRKPMIWVQSESQLFHFLFEESWKNGSWFEQEISREGDLFLTFPRVGNLTYSSFLPFFSAPPNSVSLSLPLLLFLHLLASVLILR